MNKLLTVTRVKWLESRTLCNVCDQSVTELIVKNCAKVGNRGCGSVGYST